MSGRGALHPGRVTAVLLVSLVVAVQVIRAAAVTDRARHSTLAAALWPSHPGVRTDRLYLDVASAAAANRPVPESVRADVRYIAERAPLSPDPYLIAAAVKETQGQSAAAERLLLTARDRDPRSRGTRYLLADRFLRTGRVVEGLNEIRVLIGLNDRGAEAFMPMLAAYARTPGSAINLKPFFRQHPAFEAGVLGQLSVDAKNTGLVLSLANPRTTNPSWLGQLARNLVADGQYARAYAIWSELSGGPAKPPALFNPAFAAGKAPPPFNWDYPQGPEGVAEPDGKGGLDILYYGRADAVFARQLMMLTASDYRLTYRIADPSGDPSSLHWTVSCAQPQDMLADAALRREPARLDFKVPESCAAVWLELRGRAGDLPQTTGLTIRDLALSRVAP
jgi:hypothetical protein